MTTTLHHPLVRDYLDQVDAALADVPHQQAIEIREQIAAHIEDALPDDADDPQVIELLQRIGSPEEIAAEARREGAPSGENRLEGPIQGASRGSHRARGWPLIVGAAVVCISAAALGVSLTRGSGTPSRAPSTALVPNVVGTRVAAAEGLLRAAGFGVVITQTPPGEVAPGLVVSSIPAAASLVLKGSTVDLSASPGQQGGAGLSARPATTPPVLLATGYAGRLEWQFWAKVTPLGGHAALDGTMMFLPGVSTNFTIVNHRPGGGVDGGGGPGGNPFELSRFNMSGSGPGSGFPARLLLGMTSIPAREIRIEFVGSTTPMLLPTLTSKYFPGLWFFVADVPTWSFRSVQALAADGTVLYVAPQPLP
jgi:hypothetical protein